MRTHSRPLLAASAIGLAFAAAGCSSHTTSVASADRTIDIAMTDNAYRPSELRVSEGETVTFNFRNDGTATHEAVLGDDAVQLAHRDEMTETTVEDDHDDDHGSSDGVQAVTVEPGQTGSITATFDEAGTILIGCHEPGHWESGMKATITVG
jgi:uncharacterized cupredoxin-like copper-binding protein